MTLIKWNPRNSLYNDFDHMIDSIFNDGWNKASTTQPNSIPVDITENENAFIRGIIIGRLYNSFYYQSRRILNRSPTDQEFSEFVKLLKEHENKLSSSFS